MVNTATHLFSRDTGCLTPVDRTMGTNLIVLIPSWEMATHQGHEGADIGEI